MLRLFAYKNTTYKPASIVLMACAAFSVSSSSEKGRLPENQSSLYNLRFTLEYSRFHRIS